jgi:hypothetical protein
MASGLLGKLSLAGRSRRYAAEFRAERDEWLNYSLASIAHKSLEICEPCRLWSLDILKSLPGPATTGPGAVLIGSLSRRSLDLRYARNVKAVKPLSAQTK